MTDCEPETIECWACDGFGEVEAFGVDEDTLPCETCCGSGRVPRSALHSDEPDDDQTTLSEPTA